MLANVYVKSCIHWKAEEIINHLTLDIANNAESKPRATYIKNPAMYVLQYQEPILWPWNLQLHTFIHHCRWSKLECFDSADETEIQSTRLGIHRVALKFMIVGLAPVVDLIIYILAELGTYSQV
jgi:hypothetical protein